MRCSAKAGSRKMWLVDTGSASGHKSIEGAGGLWVKNNKRCSIWGLYKDPTYFPAPSWGRETSYYILFWGKTTYRHLTSPHVSSICHKSRGTPSQKLEGICIKSTWANGNFHRGRNICTIVQHSGRRRELLRRMNFFRELSWPFGRGRGVSEPRFCSRVIERGHRKGQLRSLGENSKAGTRVWILWFILEQTILPFTLYKTNSGTKYPNS